MSADAHRFRFFVDGVVASGVKAHLTDTDVAHAHVLRLGVGDDVEIVDADGVVWGATIAASTDAAVIVDPRERLADTAALVVIDVVAGALSGNLFDQLVDGAVQAGATTITPLVSSQRDRERLTQRRERLQRLATAAAKQSKQQRVAEICRPIDIDELVAGPVGIVLDASGADALDEIELGDGPSVRLLIGPADGLSGDVLARLVGAGWRAARLGPSILRTELAAPVATAIIAMRGSRH